MYGDKQEISGLSEDFERMRMPTNPQREGNSGEGVMHAIIAMVSSGESSEENFGQATQLFVQACQQGQDQLQFIVQFVNIFCSNVVTGTVALKNEKQILVGIKFLNQLPDQLRQHVIKEFCKILMTIIRKQREINSTKLAFYAEAVAFAMVTQQEILQLQPVVNQLSQMIQNPLQRNAGLVTLAKLVEICKEKILSSPEKQQILQDILLCVGGGIREVYHFKEIDYICQTLNFRLINPEQQKWKHYYGKGHERHMQIVQLSYDHSDNTLFSSGYDGNIIYWESNARTTKKIIQLQSQQAVSLNWDQDRNLLLGCTRCQNQAPKNVIFAYDKNGEQKFWHETESRALYVVRPLLTQGRMAVAETLANDRPVVKIYDMERVGSMNSLPPPENIIYQHQQRISDIQVDYRVPSIMLSTSFDGEAYLWDLRQMGFIAKMGAKATHQSYVNSGDISTRPGGGNANLVVVTAGHDYKVKVWDARNAMRPLSVYELDDSAVIKVRFDKLGGIVGQGMQCVASTMNSLYQINLDNNRVTPLSADIPDEQKVATRDFVWVGQPTRRYLYTCQNDGVIAIYKTKEEYQV